MFCDFSDVYLDMYIPKSYRLKHELLGLLLDSELIRNNQRTVKAEEIAVTIKDLAIKLKVSNEQFKYVTPELIRAEEIKCDDFGKGICLFPWNNASTSYYERKYLILGKKYFNDTIYDVVKWVLPIAIIIVSIFTTCTNIQLNKDRSSTQQQIKQVKQELDSLKELNHSVPQTKIYLDSLNEVKRDS